jgi:PhnB protein
MSITLNPYLTFNGNAREGMEYYHKVFGGELTLSPFSDFPNAPAGHEDKIMHAALTAGELTLMASDSAPGQPARQAGDNVTLSLSGTDETKLKACFEQLAEGGKVTMPLEKQVWGDLFGMLTDKFGFHWMVNITQPKE